VAMEKSNEVDLSDKEGVRDHESGQDLNGEASSMSLTDINYHLILEGIDISYRIDSSSNIMVEKATLLSDAKNLKISRYNYLTWREKLGQQK